jgi:hypothetical protein
MNTTRVSAIAMLVLGACGGEGSTSTPGTEAAVSPEKYSWDVTGGALVDAGPNDTCVSITGSSAHITWPKDVSAAIPLTTGRAYGFSWTVWAHTPGLLARLQVEQASTPGSADFAGPDESLATTPTTYTGTFVENGGDPAAGINIVLENPSTPSPGVICISECYLMPL